MHHTEKEKRETKKGGKHKTQHTKMTPPRFIGLQSMFNSNYLRYREEDSLLDIEEVYVTSPLAKFELEVPASTGTTKGSWFHIRCCYNNKYLVKQTEKEGSLVVATAKEKVEDLSLWSCTLFEIVFSESDPNQILYFRHNQSPNYVAIDTSSENTPTHGYLYATATNPGNKLGWKIVDLESFVQLPKYVNFQWADGRYTSLKEFDSGSLHLYSDECDIADPKARFEIVTNSDGTICIISCFSKRFVDINSYGSLIILSSESGCKFLPITTGSDDTIALRAVGLDMYCGPDSYHWLCAADPSVVSETHMTVKEAVISRTVYNVRYHLSDARIYNESLISLDTEEVQNTTTLPSTMGMTHKYTITKTYYWNNQIMGKLGVKTKVVAKFPFFVGGRIEADQFVEISGKYEWGGRIEDTNSFETSYQVVAKPKTHVVVTMLATKGTFEVPFSYTQRDVLINGKVVIIERKDGVLKGEDCYNFCYEANENPI